MEEYQARERVRNGLIKRQIAKAVDRIRSVGRVVGEFFEDQWFDRTRQVHTAGNASLLASGIAAEHSGDSEWYMPARPRHIRKALRALPVRDVTRFSYVDLGCGKGRSLFVAAELSFRQIVGVELSPVLHRQACANIGQFRPPARGCAAIEVVHQNARDFTFPEDDLVLYMFNPFGAATMQHVLDNLDASRRRHARHVIVVLLWPQCGDQVAALEGMHLWCATREYQIFEAPALPFSHSKPSDR